MNSPPTFGDLYRHLADNLHDKNSDEPHHVVRQFTATHGVDADGLVAILEGYGGYDDGEVLHNVVDRIPDHAQIGHPVESMLDEQPHSPCLYNALVNYATVVVQGRWDRAEKIILEPSSDTRVIDAVDRAYGVWRYSAEVVKGRWEEGEDHLVASTYAMLKYAEDVLKGRLPDHLHNAMVLTTPDDSVREYMATYGASP
jgi:hypothetical protein